VDVEEVVEEDSGTVGALGAVWGDSKVARRLLKVAVELSAELFGIPNSMSTFSN